MSTGRSISQDQLDALFTAALEAAIGRIEKDGHFHPLVFELRDSGAIQAVAVLETGAIDGRRDVIDRLFEILRPRVSEGVVQAFAISLDRHHEGQMTVMLRAPNYAADIFVPFSEAGEGFLKRKRRVSLGEFSAKEAANEIFGEAR
ncbi:hypothetical protein K3162_06300 [Qipengyuania xiapuensis]|uniref:Uncharacterized protein n=1 Tax=Qipengyuania xiapuensis TaxID=2867236 RepID=A0ABX8ZXA5_9SPHN|nr:hypothetical protein [Qipengyuania xiapuensis]QZD93610.1 hypothetical protein K3162_06300 [Qipengyuania xiapuensis]